MNVPVWLLVIGAPILGIHAFFFWRAWRELARLILATCGIVVNLILGDRQ